MLKATRSIRREELCHRVEFFFCKHSMRLTRVTTRSSAGLPRKTPRRLSSLRSIGCNTAAAVDFSPSFGPMAEPWVFTTKAHLYSPFRRAVRLALPLLRQQALSHPRT